MYSGYPAAGHVGPALQIFSDGAFFNGSATGGKKRQVDRQERLQEVRRLDGLRVIGRLLQVIAAHLLKRNRKFLRCC